MAKQNPTNPESRGRYWFRVLRPLSWWLLLVLVLFGIRTHQRLREQTRIAFSVLLDGREIGYQTTSLLNGKPVINGEQLPIGTHTFTVSHPKGITFSTNFFVMYGKRDFGGINLQRAKGRLDIKVNPPASLIQISGPEFQLTLTNSSGINMSVPTDIYVVETLYRFWRTNQQVAVNESGSGTLAIRPKLGALQLLCNQPDAKFELLQRNDNPIETGRFSTVISGLPEGTYKVIASHHNHRLVNTTEVQNETTNDVSFEFLYGKAAFVTTPPGAKVTSSDGQYWGTTPVNISELPVGQWEFTLRLENYEPISLSLNITPNETTTVRTNLTSQSYTGSMRAARQYMAAGKFDETIEAVGDALRSQPNDIAASSLLREATGRRSITRAEAWGKQGDYIAGIKELQSALVSLPDDEQAKGMLVDFKKHEPEQRENIRLERLSRPESTFVDVWKQVPNADLFQSYEFKSARSYFEIESDILTEFRNRLPAFKITRHPAPKPETFYIEAVQDLSTYLATSAGRRQCLIVGGQTKDDESKVFFKIVEYKTEAQIKFSIGNLIGTPVAVDYVPIHASRVGTITEKLQNRITEGVSNVTAIVQTAVGQPPAAGTVPKAPSPQ